MSCAETAHAKTNVSGPQSGKTATGGVSLVSEQREWPELVAMCRTKEKPSEDTIEGLLKIILL